MSLTSASSCFEGLYSPNNQFISDALAFIEYSRYALEGVKSVNDDVVKSTVVNSCNEFILKLMEIGKLCSEEKTCSVSAEFEMCRSPDPSLFEIFTFIESYCVKKKILPTLSELGTRMMSEDDIGRLKQAFAELDVDSY